jgi:hypothetical protein
MKHTVGVAGLFEMRARGLKGAEQPLETWTDAGTDQHALVL